MTLCCLVRYNYFMETPLASLGEATAGSHTFSTQSAPVPGTQAALILCINNHLHVDPDVVSKPGMCVA